MQRDQRAEDCPDHCELGSFAAAPKFHAKAEISFDSTRFQSGASSPASAIAASSAEAAVLIAV